MRIFADFNNMEADGLVRLTCDGTLRDLAVLGVELKEGMAFVAGDGELEADVVARRIDGVWMGVFVSRLRDVSP